MLCLRTVAAMPRRQRPALPVSPPPDYDSRRRKRAENIRVIQAKGAYVFYIEWYDPAADTSIEAPDHLDVTISCRKWKWLIEEYDKNLKRFHTVAFWLSQ